MALNRAVEINHGRGLSGTPLLGHRLSAAAKASCITTLATVCSKRSTSIIPDEVKLQLTVRTYGRRSPQLHSATWAPNYAPTLKMAVTIETTELLELLGH
jgi:hypothetical protein